MCNKIDGNKSKSGKKNKQRSQKRLEARIEKIKQDGIVEQILEKEDPIVALKKKLQQAKDNKVLNDSFHQAMDYF